MEIRTVALENGNYAHFKKDPQYGTWSVNFDKGGIPERLKGQWLSYEELLFNTKFYLAHREKNKTGVKNG